MRTLIFVLGLTALPACGTVAPQSSSPTINTTNDHAMELGSFTVCLTVKDLAKSRAFYEKLGFRAVAGQPERNWLVLQNGTTKFGLFQGMFDRNILTFNPG